MEEEKLKFTRIRHAMLIGVHIQMKNYLECTSRGYLGEISSKEKSIIEKLTSIVSDVEEVLKFYYESEREMMGD